jgi:predicted enzyme related to lactoylglutathione lyase
MTLRFTPIFAVAVLLSSAVPSHLRAAAFPPLNTPASQEHIPGKLLWADLFTTDVDNASKFYCGVFGWTATVVDQKGKGYTEFSNSGTPVAGLVPRSVQGGTHPSRWIGFYAVENIDRSVAAAARDGGIVRAPSRNFPDRGFQAIVSDNDGVPIGLLQSSSGDTPDNETLPGSWNWFELYVRSPKATTEFYHDVLGFSVSGETNLERKSDFILSCGGKARGGVAPLPSGEDSKPSWLGIIRVADLDKTLAKVPGLGGEVLVAPHSVEFGSRFAIILDPTGGTIGLVEYIEGSNPANTP